MRPDINGTVTKMTIPITDPCDNCDTKGFSDCCGAEVIMGDICSDCKEHCGSCCDDCELLNL